MAEIPRDQAEGLRRLLARDAVRIVTVTGGRGGVGKTSAVLNLAVTLARRGRNVLILDENPGRANLSHQLGLEPRHDLLHLMRREKTLDQVMLTGPEGISVIPAAVAVQGRAELDDTSREWLIQSFRELERPVDVVLVDSLTGADRNVLPHNLVAQEIVVVVSGQPTSITEAYALIKNLSQNYAKRHFRVLASKVNGEEARGIFGNMAETANRFLKVTLDLMGHVPVDEKLRQASRLRRPVVEAFPAAPSAAAFRQLAEVLEEWPYPAEGSARMDAFLQSLIQTSRVRAGRLGSGIM